MLQRHGSSIKPVVSSAYWEFFGQFRHCTLGLDWPASTYSSTVHPCTTKCPGVSTSRVGILFEVSGIIISQTPRQWYLIFFWMSFRFSFSISEFKSEELDYAIWFSARYRRQLNFCSVPEDVLISTPTKKSAICKRLFSLLILGSCTDWSLGDPPPRNSPQFYRWSSRLVFSAFREYSDFNNLKLNIFAGGMSLDCCVRCDSNYQAGRISQHFVFDGLDENSQLFRHFPLRAVENRLVTARQVCARIR